MSHCMHWLAPEDDARPNQAPIITSPTGGCSLLPSDWWTEAGCGTSVSGCGGGPLGSLLGGTFAPLATYARLADVRLKKAGELLHTHVLSLGSLHMT